MPVPPRVRVLASARPTHAASPLAFKLLSRPFRRRGLRLASTARAQRAAQLSTRPSSCDPFRRTCVCLPQHAHSSASRRARMILPMMLRVHQRQRSHQAPPTFRRCPNVGPPTASPCFGDCRCSSRPPKWNGKLRRACTAKETHQALPPLLLLKARALFGFGAIKLGTFHRSWWPSFRPRANPFAVELFVRRKSSVAHT